MRPKTDYALILFSAVLLCSCTTHYNGIKPVSPTAYMPYEKPWYAAPFAGALAGALTPDKQIPRVDTLQPSLAWEAVSGTTAYDLIIYTAVPRDAAQPTWAGREKLESKRTGWFVPGKEVYYRATIRGTAHRVEEPLAPNSAYVWSVRTRSGTNTSPWATYSFRKGGKVVWKYADGVAGDNWWWPFQTPKE